MCWICLVGYANLCLCAHLLSYMRGCIWTCLCVSRACLYACMCVVCVYVCVHMGVYIHMFAGVGVERRDCVSTCAPIQLAINTEAILYYLPPLFDLKSCFFYNPASWKHSSSSSPHTLPVTDTPAHESPALFNQQWTACVLHCYLKMVHSLSVHYWRIIREKHWGIIGGRECMFDIENHADMIVKHPKGLKRDEEESLMSQKYL